MNNNNAGLNSPYRSIHPFRYADRENFFGREEPVQELFAKVLLYRLVVLFGESGAGKSSLVNAGLIPALQKEGFNAERIKVSRIPDQPILIERILANDGENSYLPTVFAGEVPAPKSPEQAIIPYSIDDFQTV